jgi:type II secretory pathway pseudopilin PulG
LLTVIAIIAILAAITFGVIRGVNERAAIGQAKVELASLSQALETYKAQYGDYPQTGTGVLAPNATTLTTTSTQYLLFNSLAGKLGPKGAPITGKSFIEASRLTLFSTAAANLPTSTGGAVSNAFIDPWGRLYVYYYRASTTAGANWSSYILLSAGPDGATGIATAPNATTGAYTPTAAQEADNIYANR